MYSSFCNNCNRNWSNLTSNCPYCGAPDHNAIHDQDKDTNMNEKTDFSSIVAESMKVGAALAVASEANNLDQMERAAKDPLFMADLRETMSGFAEADAEWWEPAQ